MALVAPSPGMTPHGYYSSACVLDGTDRGSGSGGTFPGYYTTRVLLSACVLDGTDRGSGGVRGLLHLWEGMDCSLFTNALV